MAQSSRWRAGQPLGNKRHYPLLTLKVEPLLPSCLLLVFISSRKQQTCLMQCLIQPSCCWVAGHLHPSFSFPWHDVLWEPWVMWGRGTCWQPQPCTWTPQGQCLEQLRTSVSCSSWYEHIVREHHLEEGKGSRPGGLTKSHGVWTCQCTWDDPDHNTAQSSRGADPSPSNTAPLLCPWGAGRARADSASPAVLVLHLYSQTSLLPALPQHCHQASFF